VKSIRPAASCDVDDVLGLLNAAASWLHTRGLDQWPHGFGTDRIAPMIDRGEVYLVREDGLAIATIAASPHGDSEFWTPVELDEPALYIAKLAVARDRRGQGLGEMLLRWTVDLAHGRSAQWARLDVWRTNHQLHEWYRRAGWTYVRTVDLPHRGSGTLFQRRAVQDLEARRTFT
jgi:GNAT superfamily N-acetyltransferase